MAFQLLNDAFQIGSLSEQATSGHCCLFGFLNGWPFTGQRLRPFHGMVRRVLSDELFRESAETGSTQSSRFPCIFLPPTSRRLISSQSTLLTSRACYEQPNDQTPRRAASHC